jgi:hypothetical protein
VDAVVTEVDRMAKEGNNAVAVAAVDLSVVAIATPVDHQEEVLTASTTTIVARLLKIQKTIGPCVRYVTRKGKDIQQRSVGTGLKKDHVPDPKLVAAATSSYTVDTIWYTTRVPQITSQENWKS